MTVLTTEEFNHLIHKIYRRGVIHGGLIAVATAAVWLFM